MKAKLKKCIMCGIEKPLESFSKNKSSPDGLKCYCKDCVKIQTAAYREKNRDAINERKREQWKKQASVPVREDGTEERVCSSCGKVKPASEFYRRSNGRFYSRCKECEHAAQKRFREGHPEHVKEQKKAYDKAHKAQIDAYNHRYATTHSAQNVARAKKWVKDNPERARALSLQTVHRRNARKRALPSTFSAAEWEDCKAYFGGQCAYCGSTDKLTQDHVIPVSKGGPYTRENIIPVCGCCNSRKINHDIWEWFRAQDFYTPEREEKIREYLQQADTERAGITGPCNA